MEKLGVFVTDNAESNDTAIDTILQCLRPEIQPKTCRSRYLGHIINLVTKAFLFGTNIKAFKAETGTVNKDLAPPDSEAMKKAQGAWREKGVIRKLHNIVIFVRALPQRREAFKRKTVSDIQTDHLIPILDNSIRWNSTYKSLKRALLLRDRIFLFCREYYSDL